MSDSQTGSERIEIKKEKERSIPVGSSGLSLKENEFTLRVIPTIERISNANPSDILEVVGSQLELMSVYHNEVLDQARKSFRWAIICGSIGLLFFIASVSLILLQQPANAAVISLISGTLIEVIAGINFYMYGKTSSQFADFQERLDRTQRFLLANSISESLNDENMQQAKLDIIKMVAGYNINSDN